MFDIKYLKKAKIKNPIVIGSLPGIGNVGKITIDFIIEDLGAEEIIKFYSHYMPHSVFVNEKNLIELPSISIMHKRIGEKDFVFLTGDAQPLSEVGCYEICEKLLDIFEGYDTKEIVMLGGIGMQKIPKKPKVYITGNAKGIIKKYRNCINSVYGTVGPIVGVSGLVVGLAKRRGIPAIALLAQTFGHPAYIGIRSSKELAAVLNERFKFKLNLDKLGNEIDEVEKELMERMKIEEELRKKEEFKFSSNKDKDAVNYFG